MEIFCHLNLPWNSYSCLTLPEDYAAVLAQKNDLMEQHEVFSSKQILIETQIVITGF